MVHETFHRSPGIEQGHSVVVQNIAVLIPRLLLVPRLKCKGRMDEVEIQILEPESVQTRLERRCDRLGPMIGVPQLCGHENLVTPYPPRSASCPQRLAHLALVPVSLRTIEVPKSGFSAFLVAVFVTSASGMRVPKPRAGIWPLPLLSD